MTSTDASRRSPLVRTLATLGCALLCGALLRGAVGLEAVWWLAWLAPVPLLVFACSVPRWDAAFGVFGAALVAYSGNLHYFGLVAPWPVVASAFITQALVWVLIVMVTRYAILRQRGARVVLVYPALWVSVDTLQAALSPEGNWGSLAYSQADNLFLIQLTALFGLPGLLFLLCLVPSVIAVCWHQRGLRGLELAVGLSALCVLAALAFGAARLHGAAGNPALRVGLASVDQGVDPQDSSARADQVRAAYAALIARLAAEHVALVVLPEKISMLPPSAAKEWRDYFAGLATRYSVWLALGIGTADRDHPHNYAWLFDPSGAQVEVYEKHHLAPPERVRQYASSTQFTLHAIAGHPYGLAICKDMHFASLGRAYGRRGAAVMLVPAWDFNYLDAWLAARMTLMRGVENGYAVVRSARAGLLTVSDAYGRVLAETRSADLPGNSLSAELAIGDRIPTLYTRVGDAFGWLCLGGVLAFASAALRRRASLRRNAVVRLP